MWTESNVFRHLQLNENILEINFVISFEMCMPYI